MEIIDVSMEITEEMVCYPDNPHPEISKYREIPEDSTTESKISLGSHTGTHVDAPEHIQEGGKTVKDLEIEDFYGKAQVLDLTSCEEKVDRKDRISRTRYQKYRLQQVIKTLLVQCLVSTMKVIAALNRQFGRI